MLSGQSYALKNCYCFLLPALISAPTAKTRRKQRFHDIPGGASEYVGTCAWDGCFNIRPGYYVPLRILRSGSVPPGISMKLCCSGSDSCTCARICRKLKKQSNSRRAKLSCGKQCHSKFLSACNLQKTSAFLQKI